MIIIVTTYTNMGLHDDMTGSCCEEGDTISSITYVKTVDGKSIETTLEDVHISEITAYDCCILTDDYNSERIPINNIITFEP